VASDVASRGLDIRGLPYVVQYDFPSNLETYIHRVGRTGRLAAQGHAYSFFTRSLVSIAAATYRQQLLFWHVQAVPII
jgi:superfamily II DNA/RNA helicase